MAFELGGSGQPLLGGAGAVLDITDLDAYGASFVPGTNTGWNDGAVVRYMGSPVTLAGVNGFGAGSGGATPNRGRVHQLGVALKRARNTAVGNTPIDWYIGAAPQPVLTKPVVALGGIKVWEVSVDMATETPATAIDRDCGLVFILSNNTAYASYLRAGVAAGNDYAGFGVVFDGLNGDLRWIVKKSGASGGAALNENVLVGTPGNNRLVPVKVRIFSATPTSEAKLTVDVDGVKVIERFWGSGTVLPIPADATFAAVLGYYRPMMRAAQASTSNSGLLWKDLRFRAATDVALLD